MISTTVARSQRVAGCWGESSAPFVSAHGPPEYRFRAVADLARRVPGFELAYGCLDGAVETLLSDASPSR